MKHFALALLAGIGATGSALAAASPRCDRWVTYQGLTHSSSARPTERGFLRETGHGGIGRFRARLVAAKGSGARRAKSALNASRSVEIEPDTQDGRPASDLAALLPGIARLDLQPAGATPFYEYYRDNAAWRWRAERIRLGARHERLDVNLEAGIVSAAAQLCRRVRVEPMEGVTRDGCTFEVIRDQDDGWPIVARVTRSVEAGRNTTQSASFTFERLEGAQLEQRVRQRR